uniref:Uncharacterized protein n=1 Tax=Amphimedon queenslandica TaxID=400682 RepID=A0A1X7VJN0_AMPQE
MPSSRTLIASQSSCNNDVSDKVKKSLENVGKVFVDDLTDISIDELIEVAQTNTEEYERAISSTSLGHVVVLRRDPEDRLINNYNENLLLAWQANHDIQFFNNAYACVMYVAS